MAASGQRVQLRVSLYPWVPDPAAMLCWIKTDFEATHPHVDLIVRPPARSYRGRDNPEYVADLAYEADAAVAALTGDGPDAQDVVEIDTSILETLAQRGALAPFPFVPGDFFPFAANAVTWNGVRYGVPHWACGSFLIAPVDAGRDVEDAAPARPESRGMPSSGCGRSVPTAPRRERTAGVVAMALGRWCNDGQDRRGGDGVQRFARGRADGLVGYSERLNAVFRAEGRVVGELEVAAAIPEKGDAPRLYTDALVMSPRCTSPAYVQAAHQFATYCTSDRVYETLMMSLDVGAPAPPRYLLPCTATAFGHGTVAGDRLYQQLRREVVRTARCPDPGIAGGTERGQGLHAPQRLSAGTRT